MSEDHTYICKRGVHYLTHGPHQYKIERLEERRPEIFVWIEDVRHQRSHWRRLPGNGSLCGEIVTLARFYDKRSTLQS
jgi:hypothetical protein